MPQISNSEPVLIVAEPGNTYAVPITPEISNVAYDRVITLNGISGDINLISNTLTAKISGNNIDLEINTNVANTWTALQTFNAGITGTGNTGTLTAGPGILGTANTWTATQTMPILSLNTTQTTLAGSTAGSIVYSMPEQGSSYKKFIAYANGYENDTTTAQTITFPVAFTNAPAVVSAPSGLISSTSTTGITLTSGTTTTYTGWIIIEGY